MDLTNFTYQQRIALLYNSISSGFQAVPGSLPASPLDYSPTFFPESQVFFPPDACPTQPPPPPQRTFTNFSIIAILSDDSSPSGAQVKSSPSPSLVSVSHDVDQLSVTSAQSYSCSSPSISSCSESSRDGRQQSASPMSTSSGSTSQSNDQGPRPISSRFYAVRCMFVSVHIVAFRDQHGWPTAVTFADEYFKWQHQSIKWQVIFTVMLRSFLVQIKSQPFPSLCQSRCRPAFGYLRLVLFVFVTIHIIVFRVQQGRPTTVSFADEYFQWQHQSITCPSPSLVSVSHDVDHLSVTSAQSYSCSSPSISSCSESSRDGRQQSASPISTSSGSTTSSIESGRVRKLRKNRTVFEAEQLEGLERVFATSQYLVSADRDAIAAELGLDESQVKVWFQNRRSKWRRETIHSKRSQEPTTTA